MNKTEKLLARLAPKQRSLILAILKRLLAGDEYGLQVKPLKGHKDFYRCRVGNYRIIYNHDGQKFNLIAITKRDDQTYRDF